MLIFTMKLTGYHRSGNHVLQSGLRLLVAIVLRIRQPALLI